MLSEHEAAVHQQIRELTAITRRIKAARKLNHPGDMHEAHLEVARDELEVLNMAGEARQEQVCLFSRDSRSDYLLLVANPHSATSLNRTQIKHIIDSHNTDLALKDAGAYFDFEPEHHYPMLSVNSEFEGMLLKDTLESILKALYY